MDQRLGFSCSSGSIVVVPPLGRCWAARKPTASGIALFFGCSNRRIGCRIASEWACSSIQCSISIRSSTWFRRFRAASGLRSGRSLSGDWGRPASSAAWSNRRFAGSTPNQCRLAARTRGDCSQRERCSTRVPALHPFDGLVHTSMPEWLRSIWSAGPGRADRAFCRPAW